MVAVPVSHFPCSQECGSAVQLFCEVGWLMGILSFSKSKHMWASDIKNHKNSIKGLRRLSVSKTSLSVDLGLGLGGALRACSTCAFYRSIHAYFSPKSAGVIVLVQS